MVAIVAFAEDYLGTNGFNRNRGKEEEARYSHGCVDDFAFEVGKQYYLPLSYLRFMGRYFMITHLAVGLVELL